MRLEEEEAGEEGSVSVVAAAAAATLGWWEVVVVSHKTRLPSSEPESMSSRGSTGPGGVKRDALGAQVFGDKEALARLEAIVHPVVAAKRAEFLIEHGGAPLVVFDIPLLFEKGGHESVDAIVVVSAPADVQRARVLGREGMTPEKFAHILSLQVPDAEKRARADHIIDTGVSLEETEAEVAELIAQLTEV